MDAPVSLLHCHLWPSIFLLCLVARLTPPSFLPSPPLSPPTPPPPLPTHTPPLPTHTPSPAPPISKLKWSVSSAPICSLHPPSHFSTVFYGFLPLLPHWAAHFLHVGQLSSPTWGRSKYFFFDLLFTIFYLYCGCPPYPHPLKPLRDVNSEQSLSSV